jgi:two-component system sensor histidine kinase KdpD
MAMWPTFERPRPRVALVGGLLSTLVLTAIVAPLHDHITRGVPALLFVVPVVATAVVGGRGPAFVVAAFATFSFTFSLPPIGSPRVELSEDLLALVVFSAVAFVVSALVTTRVNALEKIDEQRRALLRSVSHDLRTPLAAIHAVATDLRAGTDYDAATRDEVLDVLIDETDRLDRLVANLLSMSRIEAGTMKPRLAEVDVAELVAASAQRLERLFIHWRLEVDVPEDLPLVHADPAQLEEVCNNLLENAVRHTPQGTAVRIAAVERDDDIEITVSDDGPGLPADVIERVRASKLEGGPGLGLAICQAIVTLHGGTLRITDQRPGTCIAVTVPCVR